MGLNQGDMTRHGDVWLPKGDAHMADQVRRSRRAAGRSSYQLAKLEAAIAEVRDFRLALDIGAHVGLWSMHLAQHFDQVVAFEPVPLHAACFLRNLDGPDYDHVTLAEGALGDVNGECAVTTPRAVNSGESLVAIDGESGVVAPVARLDDLYAELVGECAVDLVKIDCEGYEAKVLAGAEATIRRDRPVVIVEQHDPHAARYGLAPKAGRDLLIAWGYRVAKVMHEDFIMVPPDHVGGRL